MKKDMMVKEYEEGGLKAIDIDSINGTLKMNWQDPSWKMKTVYGFMSSEPNFQQPPP